MRRDIAEFAVAGVIACNATAPLGVAALARPSRAPAVAAGVPRLALLAAASHGRLGRAAGAALVGAYAVWVTLLLRR
jgi:hypothetical protein